MGVFGLDDIELDVICLDVIGFVVVRLNIIGLDDVKLNVVRLYIVGFDAFGLDVVGFDIVVRDGMLILHNTINNTLYC